MIPLVLLAGFLGAGKTRFLTELLPLLEARGVRVRVVLNDFENASIDAERLSTLNALITPLNGECVCCATLPELMETLQAVPPDPGSVLLIEANGATDAVELLANLTTDRRMAHFTPPLQLTVIDAARWQKRWWHNALERSQTTTATHVFLNWTHKLSDARRTAVEASIRAVAPRSTFTSPTAFSASLAALVEEVRSTPRRRTTLPTTSLSLDGGAATPGSTTSGSTTTSGSPTPRATEACGGHSHHPHPFASVALALPDNVARAPFLDFVRSLPAQVVRAKGLVRFHNEPDAMFVWNRIPGRSKVELDRIAPDASAKPSALFIGVELPVAELTQRIVQLAPEVAP